MSVFSKQVSKVVEYVRFAQSLPTQLEAVKVYLGYTSSEVPALSPENMQKLFQDIRAHEALWGTVSKDAKSQLRELTIIASDVVKDGASLIRSLDKLDPVAQILNTVGKSSLNESDFQGENVPLDETTWYRLNNLQPYIDKLHKTSLDELGDTTATSNKISKFRTKGEKIEAIVADKVDKIKDNNTSIGNEETIGPVIEGFKQVRDRLIAQFGEGSEAAKAIQEQIEKTLAELTSREPGLQEQQRLTYSMGRLFIHLQDLGYAIIDAQSSLTKIWLESSKTCTRLTQIASNLGDIETEEMLLNFYITYKIVLKDWEAVKEEATDMYKAL